MAVPDGLGFASIHVHPIGSRRGVDRSGVERCGLKGPLKGLLSILRRGIRPPWHPPLAHLLRKQLEPYRDGDGTPLVLLPVLEGGSLRAPWCAAGSRPSTTGPSKSVIRAGFWGANAL